MLTVYRFTVIVEYRMKEIAFISTGGIPYRTIFRKDIFSVMETSQDVLPCLGIITGQHTSY